LKKKQKLKLKPGTEKFLKVLGIIGCICLGVFLFYQKELSSIKSLEYSEKASKKILFSFKKDYVLSVGENKTLNRAFESDDYLENYLDDYTKIKFVDHKDLIKNINKLKKLGYNNNDINIILSHGDNDSVTRFTKREKIKYLEEFFVVSYAKLDRYGRVNLDSLKEMIREDTLLVSIASVNSEVERRQSYRLIWIWIRKIIRTL